MNNIVITVEHGMVQDVTGLPDNYTYTIIDKDLFDVEEVPNE